MKKLRGVLGGLLSLLIFFTSLPIYAAEDIEMSSWFREEFVDVKRYDIYDEEMKDLREPIDEEEIGRLLDRVEDKLLLVDKYLNMDFEEVDVENIRSRRGFLYSLYNLEGIYESDEAIKKDPIEHLREKKVLRGNGRELYLDREISREEALAFSKRIIDHIYSKKSACAKGLMWELEKDGRKIYMLASLDLGDPYIYPLSRKIRERYEEADQFLVHVNLMDEANMYRDEIYYEDGSRLEDKIGSPLYERLKETMEAYDVEEEYYEDMKAWAVLLVLSNLSLTGDGGQLSNQHGVTNYLTEKSLVGKKEIVELEGLDYQYELLDRISLEDQIEMLDSSIRNIYHEDINEIDNREYEERVIEAWSKGDKEELEKLFEEHNSIDEVNDILLVERDRAMAKKIVELLENGDRDSYFLALHSVHFLFKDTIIDSLVELGYQPKLLSQ